MIEKSLQESEEKFRMLFESSCEAILLTNPNGSIYAANPEACRIYGRSEEEICKSGRNCTSDINDPRLEPALAERKKTGRFKGELNQVRKDGTIFPADITSNIYKDSSGNERTSMIVRDISERKKALEKIKENEEKLRTLFETMSEGVALNEIVYDDKGEMVDYRTIEVNPNFYTTADFEPGEVIGNLATKLYGMSQEYIKSFWQAHKGETEVIHTEMLSPRSNRYFYISTSPFINNRFVTSFVDITELKKAEAEIRESKELLEQLSKKLINIREEERAMIAMNLHDDIGQKLTALNLNIVWLRSRIGVQSKVVNENLEELSLMIRETINSVQDFSSDLRPAILYDLGAVAAFDSFLKKSEKQSGIVCRFSYHPEDFKTEDHISIVLYRILQESMTNIARHSTASTAIIDLRLVKDRVEMIIKDNGTGIDSAKINSPESMGIAGMIERARSVNGNINIKGKKGSGTTIQLTIPVK